MVSVRGLLNIQSLNESTHEKVSPPVSTRHGTRPILFARPTGLPPEPVPQLRRTHSHSEPSVRTVPRGRERGVACSLGFRLGTGSPKRKRPTTFRSTSCVVGSKVVPSRPLCETYAVPARRGGRALGDARLGHSRHVRSVYSLPRRTPQRAHAAARGAGALSRFWANPDYVPNTRQGRRGNKEVD